MRWTLPLLAALASGLIACGERNFDAPDAVAALNDAGADLALGEPLPDVAEGTEVTTLSFANEEPVAPGAEGSAGAIVILDGTEQARAEFERCESAVSFVCYRLANAVLRFSDISPLRQQQLAVALGSVQSGG